MRAATSPNNVNETKFYIYADWAVEWNWIRCVRVWTWTSLTHIRLYRVLLSFVTTDIITVCSSHTESKTLILTELKVIPGPTTHSSHFVAVIYTFNASYTHSAQHRINAFKLWNDSFRAAIRMAFLFQFSIIADDLVLISFATKWKINK